MLKKIKNIVEILGIIMVVISLLLVWRETEQNKTLAEVNFDLLITQNNLIANQLITQHPGIWLRGNAKDSLSKEEMVIYETIINSKSEIAFFRVLKGIRLEEFEASDIERATFVGFLHRNPGAKELWLKNEDLIIQDRKQLNLMENDVNRLLMYWSESVRDGLKLMERNQSKGED